MSRNNASPRCQFQYKYFDAAPDPDPATGRPQVLNIGSCNDPLEFGDRAVHFDIDDWSAVCKWFIQGNAHDLSMIPDKSYHTVIMGDIIEHLRDPWKAIQEAMRVCSDTLVMTIFEEWRLPGHGQWIKEGQELGDETSRKLGYKDRIDYQEKEFPQRKGFDDTVEPHLIHINQFNDDDIQALLASIEKTREWHIVEAIKASESEHEGHVWYNWLIAVRRVS